MYLSDFKEIWFFSTDFNISLQYQISLKSVEWEPSLYLQTYDEVNRRFLWLRTRLERMVESAIPKFCIMAHEEMGELGANMV